MSYEWDNKKPTAQMLGRWQPFHDGHYALFEEIIKKTGQVCIQIRDVQGVDDNPFDFETVKKKIEERLNADEVRKLYNDWDFSEEGRKRQSKRMSEFADKIKKEGNHVIADFICPTPEARSLFNADYVVWVDTIKKGRYEDTNLMFVKPEKFDYQVTTQDAKKWAVKIAKELK